MSTRERFYTRVARLTDKQIADLEAIMEIIFPETQPHDDADEVDALCGILHDYANPALIPLEKEAWAMAAAEEEKRFLEEMNSEDS